MAPTEASLFQQHSKIWLETSPHSRAYGFYQALGWHPVEIQGDGDVRLEKAINR